MTQHRSNRKKAGLLVSVRSVEEATVAHGTNLVSILDVKEPVAGSLGSVSIDVAAAIANELPTDQPNSIALGEVTDWPVWGSVDFGQRNEVLSQYRFAKLGLSGLANNEDWISRWELCLSQIPENVGRVAVAYADHEVSRSPTPEQICKHAKAVGCSVLLIDTSSKNSGNLFDFMPSERITSILEHARESNLKTVLAGSLDHTSLPIAALLEPDFVAVRGAVCGTDRTSMIDEKRIVEVASLIK